MFDKEELENIKKRMNLTFEQESDICYIIGEWYVIWKNQLVNYEDRTHRLGFAKEKLKEMICRDWKINEETKKWEVKKDE